MAKNRTIFRDRFRGFHHLELPALLVYCLIGWGCASTDVNHYNLGVENYARGRLPEAIQDYREAIRLNPDDVRARFNLAIIYQDLGRDEEAARLYESILAVHPDSAPVLVNLASMEAKKGNRGAAEKLFLQARERDRDNCSPSSQYGFFLLGENRIPEAEASFQEALKRDTRCANAYFGLGSIENQRGNKDAALRYFREAIHYNPSDLPAHFQTVEILMARGERTEAIELLRKAAALDPGRGETYLLLGRLLGQEQTWKEAEEALNKALSTGAPPEECYSELSQIYQRLAEQAANSCNPRPIPAP